MAATVDYAVTASGHLHMAHNGFVAKQGRKVALDPTQPATIKLLALGYITTTIPGGAVYDGTPAALTTYTVQAAGAGRIMHTTAGAAGGYPLLAGATLQLDAQDANTKSLVARGLIS